MLDAVGEFGNLPHNHQVAIGLARKGVKVFPCHWDFGPPDKNGKPKWKPKAPMPRVMWTVEAASDTETIDAWWTQHPDALVGMPLGPLGLLMLDPDQHDGGADGIAAFEALAKQHPGLLGGPYVQTPHGRHYFYLQTDPPHGLGEGALPPGINVRGFNGYVIAAGTMLPDGKTWQQYGDFQDAKPLPAAIVAILKGSKHTGSAAPGEVTDDQVKLNALLTKRGPKYAQTALDNAYVNVASATEGARNGTLNIQALKLGHFVNAGMLFRDTVIDKLFSACQVNGLADEGESDVYATINSGLGSSKKPEKASEILPSMLANETIADFLDFEPAFGEKPPKQTNKPRIWKGDELWDIPPVTYLIDDLIPQGTVGLMIGDSQTFKSFMALDMALTICQGMPKWHGHAIQAPEDAIVLYIAGEGGINGISQRRRGWATQHKLTRETMRDRFRLITHGVNLTSQDSRKLLVQAIEEQLAEDKGAQHGGFRRGGKFDQGDGCAAQHLRRDQPAIRHGGDGRASHQQEGHHARIERADRQHGLQFFPDQACLQLDEDHDGDPQAQGGQGRPQGEVRNEAGRHRQQRHDHAGADPHRCGRG
jgi:Bifunctional DNA primase/polymerase, N-terminal/AAA domain